MKIVVDALPISVNSLYKRGKFGTYKTKDADVFRDLLWAEVISAGRATIDGMVQITQAHFYFKDSKKYKSSDIDNLLKHAIDSVVYSGVIKDDRYVKKICNVEKFMSDTDQTILIVERMEV